MQQQTRVHMETNAFQMRESRILNAWHTRVRYNLHEPVSSRVDIVHEGHQVLVKYSCVHLEYSYIILSNTEVPVDTFFLAAWWLTISDHATSNQQCLKIRYLTINEKNACTSCVSYLWTIC